MISTVIRFFRAGRISLFLLMFFLSFACSAKEPQSSKWSGSGAGAHGDSGFLVIGFNQKSKRVTGYYEANLATASLSADCKFYFQSKNKFMDPSISLLIVSAHPSFIEGNPLKIDGKLVVSQNDKNKFATIYLSQIPPGCDWLYNGLPVYMPPERIKPEDGLKHEFENNGDWQEVHVIRAKRAYFHIRPDENSKTKVYVTIGDVIYVYAEKPDWYLATYLDGKRKAIGWIKKSEVLQISQ